jgi:hypothetical protein
MRRSKKYLLPVLVVTALAAVGAASTNAISFTSTTAPYADFGYGEVTTQGAAVSNIHYTVTNAGQTITGVQVEFGAALVSTDDVDVAFNEDGNTTGASTTACTPTSTTGIGAYETYDCTGYTESVADVSNVDISVTPGT